MLCIVVSGFIDSAAHLSHIVISSVVIDVSDSVSAAADGLELTSGLGVVTSLHDIDDSFHYGGNVVFCQVLLPTTLGRGRLSNIVWVFFFFPDLSIISIISLAD